MNKKIAFIALVLSVSSLAYGADQDSRELVGVSHQEVTVADCGNPLNLHGIDFEKGFVLSDHDAEIKCQGQVKRIGEYQVSPKCVTLQHVWYFTYVSVDFSANYECL